MENPTTWNDTQKAINFAIYKGSTAETDLTERAPQVLELLQAQGKTSLDVEKIVELIVEHREFRKGHYGASLATQIWVAHTTKPRG